MEAIKEPKDREALETKGPDTSCKYVIVKPQVLPKVNFYLCVYPTS